MYYIIQSLKSYVENKVPPGGFLYAVLSNDLTGACAKADEHNQKQLFDIVNYVYNNLPYNSWGSPEKVKKWLNNKENENTEINEEENG
jgi:hypothetical protein